MTIKKFPELLGQTVELKGWVSNKRTGKTLVFLLVRDGSGFVQCIVDAEKVSAEEFENAKTISQESSVQLSGTVVKDEKQIGGYEMHVTSFEVIHKTEDYPISKKAHGVDFLMDKRHLWLRSKRQWAIMRVRNQIIFSIHNFFQKEGFVQMDAPIFTENAAEGTTTLFETEFYGQPAYLSQSGQLYGEAMAMAMGRIYTFGPTFRAEKSKTRRHLSEFWMIEPEMAFHDNDMNMDVIAAFLKFVVKSVLENNKNELEILERPIEILENLVKEDFPRISYDEAVKILKGEQEVNGKTTLVTLENDLKIAQVRLKELEAENQAREKEIAGGVKKGKRNFLQSKIDLAKKEIKELENQLDNIPQWINSAKNFEYGSDLGGSDETVITRMFKTPILVYNWPHEIKAFYMKRDENNTHLAKGVDVLAPEGYGEIVGGGERETNLDWLVEKIHEHGLPMSAFEWYLDLRRYGSVPHAGFGLGLERMVAWICKLKHIRETIPFPRMYGRIAP